MVSLKGLMELQSSILNFRLNVMKYIIYILIAIAGALMIYNITFLDPENLLGGNSGSALIGILASSCVIVLMVILLMSRKIAKKSKK